MPQNDFAPNKISINSKYLTLKFSFCFMSCRSVLMLSVLSWHENLRVDSNLKGRAYVQ
jgi:hypothetical protein